MMKRDSNFQLQQRVTDVPGCVSILQMQIKGGLDAGVKFNSRASTLRSLGLQ